MKIRSKMYKFAGAMLLVAMLGGCSGKKTTVDEVMSEIQTTKEAEETDAAAELDDVILRVGELDADYREVLFYIYQAKQKYEKNLDSGVWNVTLKDGKTFEDYAKEELLREVTELKVICTEAKKEKVSLSEEEQVQAENEARVFLDSVSEEDTKAYGFEEEKIKQIFLDNELAEKMYQVTVEDTDKEKQSEAFEEAYKVWSKGVEIHMSVGLWKNIRF